MTEGSEKRSDPGHALYWRANLKVLMVLMIIWFIASFGLSILAVDWLDQFYFMGFPLGFWMAQQGSIVAFLLIIAIYVFLMNRLDKEFGVEEENIPEDDFEI